MVEELRKNNMTSRKNRRLAILSASFGFIFLLALVPTLSVGAYSSSMTSSNVSGIQGTVSVGKTPIWTAFDPVNGLMYVTDKGSAQASLIGSFPWQSTINASTQKGPMGATFTGSACGNVVAVANSRSSSVTLLSSAPPFNTVATIKIPSVNPLYAKSIPYAVAYASPYLFVADGVGQIDIIQCATHTLLGSVPLAPWSSLVAAFYDPVHNIVYFADDGASVIWYFDMSGNEPSCEVPSPCLISNVQGNIVDEPAFFTLDTRTGGVYFTDSLANTVREIIFNTTTDSPEVVAQQYGAFNTAEFHAPLGIAFNPINGELYVANSLGKYEVTVLCVTGSNSYSCSQMGNGGYQQFTNNGAHGFGITFDPYNGLMYVVNSNKASVSFLR